MKSVFSWVKNHPTQASAIAVIILGWFSFILPAVVIGGLGSIIGIMLGGPIHNALTPVTTAAAQITEAATTAATEVVKSLDQTTVGVTGNITKAGESIVNNVVDQTLGNILGGKKSA